MIKFPKLFIRHGAKQSGSDPMLSFPGWKQAMYTGRYIASAYNEDFWKSAKLVASPYKRTIQTAVMALAQLEFEDGEVPKIILDPRIGETIKSESCYGSTKSEIIEWLKDGVLDEELHRMLVMQVFRGKMTDEQMHKILVRAQKIINNMNTEKLENAPENWSHRTGTGEGDWETAADVLVRKEEADVEYQEAAIYFTHSTFIADVLNCLKPSTIFNVLRKFRDLAAQFMKSSDWDPDKNVPFAAVFEMKNEDRHSVVTNMFDPAVLCQP